MFGRRFGHSGFGRSNGYDNGHISRPNSYTRNSSSNTCRHYPECRRGYLCKFNHDNHDNHIMFQYILDNQDTKDIARQLETDNFLGDISTVLESIDNEHYDKFIDLMIQLDDNQLIDRQKYKIILSIIKNHRSFDITKNNNNKTLYKIMSKYFVDCRTKLFGNKQENHDQDREQEHEHNYNLDYMQIDTTPSLDILKTGIELINRRSSFRSYDELVNYNFRLFYNDMIAECREDIDQNPSFMIINKYTYYSSKYSDSVCIAVCFNHYPSIKKLEQKKRNKYYEKSGYFSKNSLIYLITSETERFDNINEYIFEIVDYDKSLIRKDQPKILIKYSTELLNLLDSDLYIKVIPICSSFFNYKPILESLKVIYGGNPLEMTLTKYDRLEEMTDYENIKYTGNLILDESQQKAFDNALTNRISLIQGPPGTGKTFLGACIVNELLRYKWNIKILIVCYTNHALDQFLEHISKNTDRILRYGRNSKNKSIEKYSVINKCREYNIKFNGQDYSRFKRTKEELDNLHLKMSVYNDVIEDNITDELVIYFETYNTQGRYYNHDNEEKQTGLWNSRSDIFIEWLSGKIDKTSKDYYWTMSKYDRIKTYESWTRDIRKINISDIHKKLVACNKELYKLNLTKEIDLINNYINIIGVTTTGLSIRKELLKSVNFDLLIIEEAGEILEPFLLSSIGRVNHLIMIGDHLQLRPKIKDYNKSVEANSPYKFNMSTFERLIINKYPYVTLSTQHRMKPEISSYIRDLCYPNLIDDEETKTRKELIGLNHVVQFVKHDFSEDNKLGNQTKSKSKSNIREAELIATIVKYIVLQGYQEKDITIITPYLKQVNVIRREVGKFYKTFISDLDLKDNKQDILDNIDDVGIMSKRDQSSSIRISSIDNYQGEESNIIIISLVRSNKEHNIGFVKHKERINVLLSRARDCLILVGNYDTYYNYSKNRIWKYILDKMPVTDGLYSKCHNHPEYNNYIKDMNDISKICPNGGCLERCSYRHIECGHTCTLLCHAYDKQHTNIKCYLDCERKCSRKHECKQKCYEKCMCQEDLEIIYDCNHSSVVKCYEYDESVCKKIIIKSFEKCNHTKDIYCYKKDDEYKCDNKCGKKLNCGHTCQSSCYDCNYKHSKCMEVCNVVCDKLLICGHKCTELCHIDKQCPPCMKVVESRCEHSRETHICSDLHSFCIEKKIITCKHEKKKNIITCGYPDKCDKNIFCNKRCDKKLSCGHQCPSLCGEKCPDNSCVKCDNYKFKDMPVEFICGELYNSIDVNTDPLIMLECGHLFTKSWLDGIFNFDDDLSSDYELGVNFHMYKCTHCSNPIRNINRYHRQITAAQAVQFERILMYKLEEGVITHVELELAEYALRIDKFRFSPEIGIKLEINNIKYMIDQDRKIRRQQKLIGECIDCKLYSTGYKIFEELYRAVRFDIKYDVMLDRLSSLFDSNEHYKKMIDVLKNSTERDMIVKAMESSYTDSNGWNGAGHWFKCINGHPYCITECGGAMQESKCPECGEKIGGNNHRLNNDNQKFDMN